MDGKIRVLIIDDSPLVRETIRAMLSEDPAIEVVGLAKDGREGVEKTMALKPDVITMDINMPVMNGWDLLNALQVSPISDKVFVAMVTSSIDKMDRERASRYPQVIGFYEKALNVETCIEIKTNPAIAHFFVDNTTMN